jgi:hypothetical protein
MGINGLDMFACSANTLLFLVVPYLCEGKKGYGPEHMAFGM